MQFDPPCKFLQSKGDPPIPWKKWVEEFHTYLSAIDADKMSAERRKNILLHLLGSEGQEIFRSLPKIEPESYEDELDVFEEALQRLELRFKPTISVTLERYHFYTRKQGEQESIDSFLTALRGLSVTCNFSFNTDEMIRDQMMVNTNNKKIKEHLWVMGNPTLAEVIKSAKAIEQSMEWVREVNAEKTEKQYSEVCVTRNKTGKMFLSKGPRYDNKLACYRCGNTSHLANSQSCPAHGKECTFCKKLGHFAKMCKEKSRAGVRKVSQVSLESSSPNVEDENATCTMTNRVLMVKVDDNVSAVDTAPTPLCCLKLLGTSISVMADSGSPFTILSNCSYEDTLKNVVTTLHPPDVKAVTYDGRRIDFLGYFEADSEFKGRCAKIKFYVAKKGVDVLGWHDQRKLKIILNPSLPDPVLVISEETSYKDVLEEFPEVYKNNKLGKLKGFTHCIKLKNSACPVKQRLRNVPFSIRNDLQLLLAKLQAEDVIEEVESSEWISPIVLTKKNNGDLRLCIDLRALNANIVVDSHPLPKINDLLAMIEDASIFSTLDLRNAYHQVELVAESRPLTAFITPYGIYQYKRMPFGLASAASVFQRAMHHMFKDLHSNVRCFQDDILLFSKDMESHVKLLRVVSKRLSQHGLVLSAEKCKLCKDQVEYLGHTITEKGITPKVSLVEAIKNAPAPKDREMLRSFTGLCEYYSKFVENFATIMEPLRKLLRKEVRFEWKEEQQHTFDSIKDQIIRAPTLKSYMVGAPCIITTDASSYGLGAVLQQGTSKHPRTIAFASRTLTDTERKYAVIEKELLGCVWAIEHFRNFIWGSRFTLHTDHKPLVSILSASSNKALTARIARLCSRLQEYQFDVLYIPGKNNQPADCLSRLPCTPSHTECESEKESVVVATIGDACCVNGVLIEEHMWKQEMLKDDLLSKVMNFVSEGWPARKFIGDDVQSFFQVSDELSTIDGMLFRNDRIIPPVGIRKILINNGHSTHMGMSALKNLLRQFYWWPAMDHEIERHIRICDVCLNSDKNCRTQQSPLQNVPWPSCAWQKVGLDISGPFRELPPDMKFAIVLVDYHSKWAEVVFSEKVTTEVVLAFLKDTFFREGLPEVIVSDNGVQFLSLEMREYLKIHGIHHIQTALYDPQTNGQVERFNRFLKDSVKLVPQCKTKPFEFIKKRIWEYNITPHTVTGVSPFYLLRGRNPTSSVCPWWIHKSFPVVNKDNLGEVISKAKGRVEGHQFKAKLQHDSKFTYRPTQYQIGDLVRIRLPRHVPKGRSNFSDPLRVVRLNRGSVVTQDGKCWSLRRLSLYKGISADSMPFVTPTTDTPLYEPPVLNKSQPERLETSRTNNTNGSVDTDLEFSGSPISEHSVPSDNLESTIADRVKHCPRNRIPSRKVLEGF